MSFWRGITKLLFFGLDEFFNSGVQSCLVKAIVEKKYNFFILIYLFIFEVILYTPFTIVINLFLPYKWVSPSGKK
jgi:hypothetical protein